MKCILFANTDWYLYNFRLSLAVALRDAGNDVILVSPTGPYGNRLRALGFQWIPAPMERKSLNPIHEAALLFWLWRLVRRERADVIHGFTIKCAVYGALVGRLARIARINAVAGMGYVFISDSLKARSLRPLLRILMAAALGGDRSRLILQNRDDVALFENSEIVSPDRIRLLRGSGVDCSRFIPRMSGEGENRPPRVILAARMLWDKGIGEFVEASRLLRAQGHLLKFQLAGAPDAGNPASIPEEQLLEWQRDGLIEWLGQIADMPELMRQADIVVLPSYREGLPKSLIEAAACACPLITTDVPGCREVVTNGVDGLLVPVRDPEALAEAILKLALDPEFANQLGRAARQKALEEFDERIVIEGTLAVYDELA